MSSPFAVFVSRRLQAAAAALLALALLHLVAPDAPHPPSAHAASGTLRPYSACDRS